MFLYFVLQILDTSGWLFAQPWIEFFNESEVNNAKPITVWIVRRSRWLSTKIFSKPLQLERFCIYFWWTKVFTICGEYPFHKLCLIWLMLNCVIFSWSSRHVLCDTKVSFWFSDSDRRSHKHPQLTATRPPVTFVSFNCSLSPACSYTDAEKETSATF